jgi:hypothetical protein
LPHKNPGETDFRPFALDLGASCNPAFEAWAEMANQTTAGGPPADLKKDFLIERLDRAGQPLAAYRVVGCWVAEHIVFPDRSEGRDPDVAQRPIIANEGWRREG